ncbi:hypothetical protein BV25DRAFT_1922185 [Artomyces pyxidatus]|uniref:Uncharacterized protein n=1 Tax=Artomyces pyxidatus TaxID=48021 RepID=A0ACB8SGJ2_9AGAM|nr:hypothetical protein BV25DRAFT_1922185 [Artomyces pyxidatus]
METCFGFPADVVAGLLDGIPHIPEEKLFFLERHYLPSNHPNRTSPQTSNSAVFVLQKDTIWALHLDRIDNEDEKYGLQDPSKFGTGEMEKDEYVLRWSCNNTHRPAMEARCLGQPDAEIVSRFFETTIVHSKNRKECEIPAIMVICVELEKYLPVLGPMLKSFPVPFVWMVEPIDIARFLVAGDVAGVFDYHIKRAMEENSLGDQAYNDKDHSNARVAYTSAIRHAGYAVKIRLDTERKDVVRHLLPVLLANRALELLHDEVKDFRQALLDAIVGELLLPGYWKVGKSINF